MQAAARSNHGAGFFIADSSLQMQARIGYFPRDLFGLFHALHGLAAQHVDAQALYGCLNGGAVFTTLDGLRVEADDLDPVASRNL